MLLKDKVIYIVEDNEDNIFVILSLLREHGAKIRIDWFAKGEASKIVESLPLDLIVLDLMLPNNRSGFDVFEELRQLPQLESVPIIAVSASEPSIAVPKAHTMGFSGFIAKPIDFEKFPHQIAAIIDGQAIWDSG